LKLREHIATTASGYATFQVLCLTEQEKRDAFYADCPYISGELYKHIQKFVDHNDDLKECKSLVATASDEDLIAFCNARCAVFLLYMNGMNHLRAEFNDRHDEKDWLRPFVQSMLVWEEYRARTKIGLPDLVPSDLEALKHSAFMNLVMGGAQNPYYEWQKAFEK
jgi:hypothetical protein